MSSIMVKRMDQCTAHLVSNLYRKVYGDDFPVKSVYDPEALVASNKSGDLINVLAFYDGNIAGQAMVGRSPWNVTLFEMMGLIVLPEYRKSGIAELLSRELIEKILPEVNWTARYTESTTAHRGSQKVDVKMGHVHTALALNILPSDAYSHDELFNVKDRVSCVMSFAEKEGLIPQRAVLPEIYGEYLKEIASYLQPRVFDEDSGYIRSDSELSVYPFESAGTVYITALKTGRNFYRSLHESLSKNSSTITCILQLPLESGISEAVREAQSLGFSLGGYLPRWFKGSDGLLLQRTTVPDWSSVKVLPGAGERLLDIVRESMEGLN